MTLDELFSNETIKDMQAKRFSIEPDSSYDRAKFVDRCGDLFDLEEYYTRLRKDTEDKDALDDIIGLISKYFPGGHDKEARSAIINELRKNPHEALQYGDTYLQVGIQDMAKFVEGKRKYMLDKLDANDLYSIFQRIPLYKSKDKAKDRPRKLRDKIMQIQQASQKEEDPSKVLQEELQELYKGLPKELQICFSQHPELMSNSLSQLLIRNIQKEYKGLFMNKDKKLDKQQIYDYLEQNYKIATDFIDNEIPKENEKEKLEYWDKNLKRYYLEIARALHKPEKKIEKEEKDSDEKKEKDARKKLAASRGFVVP